MVNYDVIIIGLGPTSGTLANLLGMQGNSVLILEKEASLFPLPRAVHFDDEIMRVFQTIGITNKFLKQTIINKGTKFVNSKGETLIDWPRPKFITENGWRPSYRFHQPDLERSLRKNLKKFKNITIKQNANAVNILSTTNYVETTFEENKTLKKIKSKYLVGCDGGNSFTRNQMNVSMIDLGFKQRWAVFDLILKSNKTSLPDRTIQFCNSERPATYCRNVGRRRRWEFALQNNERSEDILLEKNVWKFLKPWVSKNEAFLERKTIYTFQSAIAKIWMQGRIFIAGDAAHLTPPFMGQGLCAGIRDVSNLSWKLSQCIKSGHNEFLLKTYQKERFSNVKTYIKTTMKMGEFINEIGTEKISKTVYKKKDGSYKMSTIRPKIGFGLGDKKDKNFGKIFPNIKLRNNSYLDQKYFGNLIYVSQSNIKKYLNTFNLKTITEKDSDKLNEIFNELNIKAAIIRPDRFILTSLEKNADINKFNNLNKIILNLIK